jgi:hypothetical protein
MLRRMRRHGSYWNEPEASVGIVYIKSSCLSRDTSTGYYAHSNSSESTRAFCHLVRLGAGIEPRSFLGSRDHERPALLKISQQRAAGGCSSEVLERMPAQNGAR